MARSVKKKPEQWKKEILNAAQELFIFKGYEETSVADIMNLADGAKGMFCRFFESKEEVIYELGNRMFFENNPFEAVMGRELLEEGKMDGSVRTEYAKELSELLPLINFWLIPSVFPATEKELQHKYRFVVDVLNYMGLSLFDEEAMSFAEKFITDISGKGGNKP